MCLILLFYYWSAGKVLESYYQYSFTLCHSQCTWVVNFLHIALQRWIIMLSLKTKLGHECYIDTPDMWQKTEVNQLFSDQWKVFVIMHWFQSMNGAQNKRSKQGNVSMLQEGNCYLYDIGKFATLSQTKQSIIIGNKFTGCSFRGMKVVLDLSQPC